MTLNLALAQALTLALALSLSNSDHLPGHALRLPSRYPNPNVNTNPNHPQVKLTTEGSQEYHARLRRQAQSRHLGWESEEDWLEDTVRRSCI